VPGEDVEHAVNRARGRRIDRDDLGVRMRRAHECRVGLAERVAVLGVASLSRHEPPIFASLDRSADAEARHGGRSIRSARCA
jgi:hypothetical protein